MTDRVNGFTITLDKDYRIDDLEATLTAFKMIKGVLDVTPHIVGVDDHMAYTQAMIKARRNLVDFIMEKGLEK